MDEIMVGRPRLARWVFGSGLGCLVLVVTLCGAIPLLWPVYYRWSLNHLTQVQGTAELILPAEWHPGAGQLSPDGRYMVVGWKKEKESSELVLWDLKTDFKRHLSVTMDNIAWINDGQFVVRNDMRFTLITASPFAITPIDEINPLLYRKRDGFQHLEPVLHAAKQVYAVQGWYGLYQLFIHQETNVWTWATLNAYDFQLTTNQEVAAMLNTFSSIDVDERNSTETEAQRTQRLTSPDGRYYVRYSEVDGQQQLTIYTQAGVAVASASKAGWYPYFVGWAHDSSGVYFQTWISGSSAAVLENAKPMFKLSPMTPEDVQAQRRQQIIRWAGGGAALVVLVAGGVVWWWRRRRATTR